MIGMVEWRYGVVGMVDGRVWFTLVCNSLVVASSCFLWFKFCDGFFPKLYSSTLVRGTFEAAQLLLGSNFVRELQLLVVGLKDLLM